MQMGQQPIIQQQQTPQPNYGRRGSKLNGCEYYIQSSKRQQGLLNQNQLSHLQEIYDEGSVTNILSSDDSDTHLGSRVSSPF